MFSTTSHGLRLFFVPALIILSVTLLALACGDDEVEEFAPGDETPAAGETPTDGAADGEPVAFNVSMGDNFFEANTFTVSPGQQVTFDLVNDGVAVHNMRVDGGDGEYATDDDTVSDPELFQAADTGTLVWTAPDESGEFIFRCDFHPIEMVGTISVE
jgi:plastocyanin